MNGCPQRRSHLSTYRWLRKIGSGLRRYLPAEIAGTTMALLGVTLALRLDQSLATAAVVGVWSEACGFYGAMIIQDWRTALSDRAPLTAELAPKGLGRSTQPTTCCRVVVSVRQTIGFLSRLLRNLLLEFGVAELLDPLILRPALLILAMQLIPNLSLAFIAGKLTADLVFYTITICSLEARKKLLIT